MFFINDQQPGPRHWREDRGTGADDDGRVAAACALPGAETFTLAEPGVQHGKGYRKTCLEAFYQLRGQADFRHQQQCLPAAREYLLDDLQIDLGLAAAGDAFQQETLKVVEVFQHLVDGVLLCRVQDVAGRAGRMPG